MISMYSRSFVPIQVHVQSSVSSTQLIQPANLDELFKTARIFSSSLSLHASQIPVSVKEVISIAIFLCEPRNSTEKTITIYLSRYSPSSMTESNKLLAATQSMLDKCTREQRKISKNLLPNCNLTEDQVSQSNLPWNHRGLTKIIEK